MVLIIPETYTEKLEIERAKLRNEQKQLLEELAPVRSDLNVEAYRAILSDYMGLIEAAEPAEIQRLIRLLVRKADWLPTGLIESSIAAHQK